MQHVLVNEAKLMSLLLVCDVPTHENSFAVIIIIIIIINRVV